MPLFLDLTEPGHGETLRTLLAVYAPWWATAALGFVGLYGLLPQPRRAKPIFAGFLAALAILHAGFVLMHHHLGAWPETVLFYSFSLLAIVGGVLMLSQKNPVHGALSFALVVLSTCGLFLLLAAPFLMAATIIVYAGAIVVTFLFVIMLAQQAGLTSADARSREPFLASLAGFVLLGSLWCVLDKTYNAEPVLRQLRQIVQAKTIDEVTKLWGEPKPGDNTLPVLEVLRQTFPGGPVDVLEPAWAQRDLAGLKKHAQALLKHHQQHQHWRGTLVAPDPDAGPPTLPAQNVAGLGRTLFTSYLIPVEMAGVLLLVATIGAIVIAGRREAGVR